MLKTSQKILLGLSFLILVQLGKASWYTIPGAREIRIQRVLFCTETPGPTGWHSENFL
jgi:hypothetical protein